MSLSITCKNARDAKQLSDVAVAAARAKFASECGVSLDDIGGIVIDEVSFITAAVFGHVDHMLRVRRPMVAPMQEHPCSPMPTHAHPCSPMLTHAHSCSPMLTHAHPCSPMPTHTHPRQAVTGNLHVPCGGIPILLSGDNHQK